MTEDQLRRIESELQVSLPDDYRTVMLAFPFRPIGNDRVYWLYDDPKAVIGATRHPLNEFYEGKSWRPTYLAIGETGMGDQYLLDLARRPSPVLCLSHETHEVEEDYPNLAAFVAGWTRDVAQAIEQQRGRAKRWWRFW